MNSGYQYCDCRDCFELIIVTDNLRHRAGVGQPEDPYCDGCLEHACPDYQGVQGMSQECQRPDAYGDEEEY